MKMEQVTEDTEGPEKDKTVTIQIYFFRWNGGDNTLNLHRRGGAYSLKQRVLSSSLPRASLYRYLNYWQLDINTLIL